MHYCATDCPVITNPGAHMKMIVLTLLTLSSAVMAADPAPLPVTKASTEQQTASGTFVRQAAQGSLLEVEASKLALTKTSNANIKAFAQQMVTDHTNANVELQGIAGKQYLVPTQLNADHQAKLELLISKSGAEFDQAYSQAMVHDHNKALELFSTAASDTAISPELRQFARKTLSTLQQHQLHATKLPAGTTK